MLNSMLRPALTLAAVLALVAFSCADSSPNAPRPLGDPSINGEAGSSSEAPPSELAGGAGAPTFGGEQGQGGAGAGRGGAGGEEAGGAGGEGVGGRGGTGGAGAACPHDACGVGAALEAGCSPCVQKVCDKDPSCCGQAWSAACVSIAASVVACACGVGGAGGSS